MNLVPRTVYWETPTFGNCSHFYRNDGTLSNPEFTLITKKIESIDIGSNSAPAFADIDNDGDFYLY